MAKTVTPRKVDLSEIGTAEVHGLYHEDVTEHRSLRIRNLEQLVDALLENNWDLSRLNNDSVFFSAQQVVRIATSVDRREDTPNRPEVIKVEEEADLSKLSIKQLGISDDELHEWRYHDIGSLAAAYNTMRHLDGDFSQLSDDIVVIEKAQSDTFGDLLLAHPLCPKDIKERFLPSEPLKVEVPAPKPAPASKAQVKTQPSVPAHLKVAVPPAPKPMASRPQAQQQATPQDPQKESVPHAVLAGALGIFGIKI